MRLLDRPPHYLYRFFDHRRICRLIAYTHIVAICAIQNVNLNRERELSSHGLEQWFELYEYRRMFIHQPPPNRAVRRRIDDGELTPRCGCLAPSSEREQPVIDSWANELHRDDARKWQRPRHPMKLCKGLDPIDTQDRSLSVALPLTADDHAQHRHCDDPGPHTGDSRPETPVRHRPSLNPAMRPQRVHQLWQKAKEHGEGCICDQEPNHMQQARPLPRLDGDCVAIMTHLKRRIARSPFLWSDGALDQTTRRVGIEPRRGWRSNLRRAFHRVHIDLRRTCIELPPV